MGIHFSFYSCTFLWCYRAVVVWLCLGWLCCVRLLSVSRLACSCNLVWACFYWISSSIYVLSGKMCRLDWRTLPVLLQWRFCWMVGWTILHFGCGYVSVFFMKASISASWYGVAASLNIPSSDEMSDNLLFIDSGIFFIMIGGWLDLLCMYVQWGCL